MADKDAAIWNLQVLRDALKRDMVQTEKPMHRLGLLELVHDTLHKLDVDCGDPTCDGPDIDVLSRFVDHCT